MQIKLNDKIIDLSTPVVMGIVNITPDSFYSESRHSTEKHILQSVEKILADGGRIVDIGGYSSRPSAANVTTDEEIRRLSFALDVILKEFPDTLISIDTFRSEVAKHTVDNYQVAIINDISGGTLDENMFGTIAELNVAYVLMHMRGTPATMQQYTQYDNLTAEVLAFLQQRLSQLRLLGVNDVIIDPGFGFSKTLEQNYTLLREMSYLSVLDAPILAGVSRKSMIYNLLDITPQEALNGTTAVNMLALSEGASMLRVHDVKEAVEAVRIYELFKNSK
ncbi:dihydropteroate synthase [Paludibacter sp. 221]|uniref:dihydropteroate synthase n=1 Tax=Paludibacter sp. 221 TaxID=2302939 RepID=UPI0013D4266D|nr:dihydropteroate synthase [Paludibacter sp. 221]NDV45655.1 dihydropteroate synthase [Paludibacter sp. 221]